MTDFDEMDLDVHEGEFVPRSGVGGFFFINGKWNVQMNVSAFGALSFGNHSQRSFNSFQQCKQRRNCESGNCKVCF
jgi:hypothetical protein